MWKALVIGENYNNLDHEYKVRCAFLNEAPRGWTCDIAIQWSHTTIHTEDPIVKYAVSRKELYAFASQKGYHLIIDANWHVWTRKEHIDAAFDKGVWPVQAHCSNSRTHCSGALYNDLRIGPPRLFSAIVCSSGTRSTQNENSYGPGLELYREGYICNAGALRMAALKQSYGTPGIAALMAHAKSAGFGFWDARALLRSVGTSVKWSKEEGFGYTSLTEADLKTPKENLPLYGPVDVSIVGHGNRLAIRWRNFASSRWAETVIYSSTGKVIYEGTGTYHEHEWESEEEQLVFRSRDKHGNLSDIQHCDIWAYRQSQKDDEASLEQLLRNTSNQVDGILAIKVEENLPSSKVLYRALKESSLRWDVSEGGYLRLHDPTQEQIEGFIEMAPNQNKRGYAVSYAAFIEKEPSDKVVREEAAVHRDADECLKPCS